MKFMVVRTERVKENSLVGLQKNKKKRKEKEISGTRERKGKKTSRNNKTDMT